MLAMSGFGSRSMRIVNWCLVASGQRDLATAKSLVNDLASRLSKRVQVTTDGHRAYLQAIEDAFGLEVDYAATLKNLLIACEPTPAI